MIGSSTAVLTRRAARWVERHAREQPLDQPRHLAVELRRHPDRGALEDREVLGPLRELGDQLHRGRAGADDRDPLAVELGGVVPPRGVHDRAGEVPDALDVGQLGLGQEAGRGDQVRRPQPLAAGDPDLPLLGVLVPARALDDGAEPHVPAQVVAVGHVLGVLLQLRTAGVPVRPPRVRLEGVGVGDARDVHRQPGVAVDVPGPAQVVLALEHHEVVDAQPLERDGGAHAAEPGPDDDRLVAMVIEYRSIALSATRCDLPHIPDVWCPAPPLVDWTSAVFRGEPYTIYSSTTLITTDFTYY